MFRSSLVVVAVVMLLAACGGGDDGASPTAPSTTIEVATTVARTTTGVATTTNEAVVDPALEAAASEVVEQLDEMETKTFEVRSDCDAPASTSRVDPMALACNLGALTLSWSAETLGLTLDTLEKDMADALPQELRSTPVLVEEVVRLRDAHIACTDETSDQCVEELGETLGALDRLVARKPAWQLYLRTTEDATTVTATTTDATTTTEATTTIGATTVQQDPTDELLRAVEEVCEVVGQAYSDAVEAFLEAGPSADTAALLDPAVEGLDAFGRVIASTEQPGVEQLRESVRSYQVGNTGLSVLFTEGETAYQAQVPAAERERVVNEAEVLWDEGTQALFGANAPDSPTASEPREC